MRRGSCTPASISTRVSLRRTTAGGAGRSGTVPAGIGPKYFSTSASVASGSMSPPIAIVALLGTYHVRKNCLTSSRLAASRSSGEPMARWWYGCVGGYVASSRNLETRP